MKFLCVPGSVPECASVSPYCVLLPGAHAQGVKQSVLSVVVIVTKIARSSVLGITLIPL